MKIIIELLIVLIVVIGIILFLLYKVLNNKYNVINIKVSKSEKKLLETEKNKFNLLIKAIDILNDNKKFDENLYHDFLNLKLDNISLNELNDTLIKTDNNIEEYLSQNEKIVNSKKFKDIYNDINKINVTINATRKYYNDNAREYNKFINKFPTSLFAKIKRLNEKEILKDNQDKQLKIFN